MAVRGGKDRTAGGRQRLTRQLTSTENPTPIGHRMHVSLAKNKVAPPFQQADFPMFYGVGFDWTWELAELCKEHGILQQSGAWFSDPVTGGKWQGLANLVTAIREDKRNLGLPLRDRLFTQVMSLRGLNPDGTYIEGFARQTVDVMSEFDALLAEDEAGELQEQETTAA